MENSFMAESNHSAENEAGDFYLRVLSYVFALYASLMLLFNLLRFWGFGFDTLDFGTFYQFIWNSANGNWFDSSTKFPFSEDGNRLGFHFSVLSTIFGVAVYKIFSVPESLLALHVFAVSFACFPIFLAVREVTGNSRTACFLAVCYLLNPITFFHVFFSFQDVSLAVLALCYCYYYTIKKHKLGFLLACFCLVIAKEHYGLFLIGFGFLWWFQNKQPKFASLVAVLGAAVFAVVNFYIMPHFSPIGENFFLQENTYNPNYIRYQWLNQPLPEQLEIVSNLLFKPEVAFLLAIIFVPFLGFAISKPIWLLPVAPLFAVNLLSQFPAQKTIFLYYWAETIPAVVIATAFAIKSYKKVVIPTLIINFTLFAWYSMPAFQKLPLLSDTKMDWSFDKSFEDMVNHLPKDKLLIAETGIGPHVASRRKLAPIDIEAYKIADVIVYRVNPYIFIPSKKNANFDITRYNVQKLMLSKKWGITYWKFPYIIFERGKKSAYDFKQIDKEIYTILKTYR